MPPVSPRFARLSRAPLALSANTTEWQTIELARGHSLHTSLHALHFLNETADFRAFRPDEAVADPAVFWILVAWEGGLVQRRS